MNPTRHMILTTDVGVEMDDQWALAHLALSEEFELLGVVTTHAPMLRPPAAEATARVAREVLDQLPLRSRPIVIAGSSTPLSSKKTPNPNAGVDLIVQTAKRYAPDDRLTVLAIGAATDVASALLMDSSLCERIEIVAMAFDRWTTGGDPFNVRNDLKAWQVMLESAAPITVGDCNVCAKHLRVSRDQARGLFYPLGKPGHYLADLLIKWLDSQQELAARAGDRNSWPVWDEVTVAYLLGLTETAVYRRPTLRDDLSFDHSEASDRRPATIRWITSVDADGLWSDLVRKLAASSAP